MIQEIAEIIRTEVAKHHLGPLAENLRVAAWYVMDEFPTATSGDFGRAAVICGLHKQGAMNRWNEAKQNALV